MNPYQTRASGGKPELLAPAGSYEKGRIAFLYGADAVYAGGKRFNLRVQSRNLDDEELAALAFFARTSGKRLYVTLNSLMRPNDIDLLRPVLEYLQEIEVSGIIMADPGAVLVARSVCPDIPLHLSTQASTTNHLSVRFWENQGVRRINLARELSFDEIEMIRRHTSLEIEVFVHGSMCVSYSGRCLLSSVMTGRSANAGHCAQPCRWSYRLVEEKRPGWYFPIGEDGQGSYILNAQDLCLIEDLHRLAGAGIDAFKIEGRMKGAHYVASVVRAYRRTLDASRSTPQESLPDDTARADILAVSHRPYTRGFMFPDDRHGDPAVALQASPLVSSTLAGIVRPPPDLYGDATSDTALEDGRTRNWTHLEVRSPLHVGDRLSFLFPDGRNMDHNLDSMEKLTGRSLQTAHPNTWIRLPIPFPTFPFQVVRCSRSEP